MKYQLIKPKIYSEPLQQILYNRNIPEKDWEHYLNTTDKDINNPILLNEELLQNATAELMITISQKENAIVIVDSDCDGYSSSALLINYLYDLFPTWVKNHLRWCIHSGKEHGLVDCMDVILQNDFQLVLIPDAGTNDFDCHNLLYEKGIKTIVLDHHELENNKNLQDTPAIIINNQTSNYPNKFLSGVGIVWQFCRYIDQLLNEHFSDKYIDLVALGDSADMMSLTSIETKHLINKGLKQIKNPFFEYMVDKNRYSIGDTITSFGVAFYIAPYVNAIVRSGTQEEKNLLFNSMLNFMAFQEVLSNKRGHKLDEKEPLVIQAVRTATNVKNRQTRAQDAGMEILENMIEQQQLLNHKVLIFLLEKGQIEPNIAGLCANKIMAKYQRPTCILTKVLLNDKIIYQGSARGCDKIGVTQFKDICEQTGVVEYVVGHQGAFGLSLKEYNINNFIIETDKILNNMPSEPIYYVDFLFSNNQVDANTILTIVNYPELWGKDMDEPYIAIQKLKVTKDMVTLMSADSKPTLKIILPNKVALIKFNSNQEEYNNFISEKGYIEFDIIGKCNKNEWNGNVTAQVFIKEYQKVGESKYIF